MYLGQILEDTNQWEHTRYIRIKHREILKVIITILRSRSGLTHLQMITRGNVEPGDQEAKNLAEQGASKELYDEPNLEINPNFNLTGAQLDTMTQSLAYRGICERKKKI